MKEPNSFPKYSLKVWQLFTFLFLVPLLAMSQDTIGTAGKVLITSSGSVKIERLAKVNEPWGMTFMPDGSLLVTEKAGQLHIFSKGKLSAPITGLPPVVYHGQGGLLDVEIDPAFTSNKLVYIYYAEAAQQQPKVDKDTPDHRLGDGQELDFVTLLGGAVARGRLEGNTLKNVKVIWRQEPKKIGRGHFGGRMVFAPDGTLFITSGERQRFEPAQDSGTTLGKVIRINSDGSIPKDNPFVNKKGVRPEIWSMGHRNPLGAAINPSSKKLWIHEMGPLHGDEINIPEAGKNYGWPLVSNGDNYDGTNIPDHETRPEFAPPAYYWHPAVSPSGIMFYSGNLFDKWQGNLFLGGMSVKTLLRLTLKGDQVVGEERIPLNLRIRDLIQAPDGSVWLLTDYKDGELLRMSPVKQ